jgi:hypothetical protein
MNSDNARIYGGLLLMDDRGGSFVKALAACYCCADSSNRKALETAFPEYFEKYRTMWDERPAQLTQRSE